MIKMAPLVFLFCLPVWASAQTVDLNRTVTLKYRNQQLGFILSDISRKYGIPFSYSSNFIPVSQRMTINRRNVQLRRGLNELFAPTQIIYAVIGNGIALRIDESKEVITKIEKPNERQQDIKTEEIPMLKRYSYPILVYRRPIPPEELERLKKMNTVRREKEEMSEQPNAEGVFLEQQPWQVTLLPPMSTNEPKAEETVNTFSFNILWGKNGGVDGLEFGGLVNIVVHNMHGVQVAGIANQVNGDMDGIQLANFFNTNEGMTKGLQIAGLANIAKGEVSGVQIATVGNYALENVDGPQIGGVFNYTKKMADWQISPGFNKAEKVNELQIGFINVADSVRGRQIGIVNFSRHSEKSPIGFVNINPDGYNKVELSVSDALYANAGLKLGTQQFYNIFQIGGQLTENIWGLGYGFGTILPTENGPPIHLEYVAMHLNEKEIWTKELNLLNQFRLNVDWSLGEGKSLFVGPTLNLLASKLTNVETMEVVGSDLPLYTLFNNKGTRTNWKMWMGVSAGYRF